MRRALLALTVLAALLAGGCGIPDRTDVRVLGQGPPAGPAQGNDNVPPVPVTRSQTIDTATFIGYFLEAAAGDPAGALDRVTKFMTPEARAAFKPRSAGVEVVRPIERPLVTPGNNDVTLDVQEVGVLQDDGQLVPSSDARPIKLPFRISLDPEKGLFITEAPSMLLLSDAGLNMYYQPHTIYFWNTDNTGLVPDVRYLPLNLPTVQQPTVILNWLAGGPADWLKTAAHGLPQGTTVPDNIPAISDNKLQINLNLPAATPGDTNELDRLRQQLQWSLRPLTPRTLELKIGKQNAVTYTDAQYLDSNAAARLLDAPDRFVVYNGVIRQLSESPRTPGTVPLLKPEANRGVQSAALSTSVGHTFAAVVTGSATAPVLRVAAAPTGRTAELRAVGGLKGPLGHPAWAITAAGDTDTAVGLITSNSRLYSFGPDGSAAQPVDWQGGDPGPITAFSIAPDGHRVALVAGGKLYRTVLTIVGDGVALAAPDQILPPDLRSVSAVAWSSEGWLVVGGVLANDRVTIVDVSIDGARSKSRLDDIGTDMVTYLTAYPANPATVIHSQEVSSAVAYVARGGAWTADGYVSRIIAADLAGPTPSPSAPAGTTPTAPFFLD